MLRPRLALASGALLFSLASAPVSAQDCQFIRGNIVRLDQSTGEIQPVEVVDLNDAVNLVAYLFLGRNVPLSGCPDAADVNDDGLVTLADYTYLIETLTDSGPTYPAALNRPRVGKGWQAPTCSPSGPPLQSTAG